MPDKKSDSKSAARSAAEKLVDKAEQFADDLAGSADVVPGTPGSRPPTVAEPTEPTSPLPPKADQKGAGVTHEEFRRVPVEGQEAEARPHQDGCDEGGQVEVVGR